MKKMANEQTQKLAERIASLLQENEKGSDDSAFLRASLEKINQRLDKIEENIAAQNSNNIQPSAFSLQPSQNHPSQDRFVNIEELADEIIKNMQNEKACPYEPTGKPCDHCAMCSSRGF
jgi:ribonucleotide reductase alpha subunit